MSTLIFDKYEVIRRLAVGGMGEIFLARQTGVFERLVILKSLLPSLAERAGAVEMFLDEARVAATLSHPNIIAIYEVGRWKGSYLIAMEYIKGDNLQVLGREAEAKGVAMPIGVAVKIIRDAALGLDYAHNATDDTGKPLGIVHRDISPHNIMVTLEGTTKVVDFGIAVAENRLSARTATGTIKGKIQYMAPEQITGERVDPRADQYALGVCLWEMLVGERLVKMRGNEIETLMHALDMSIEAPSALRPSIPKALDEIVTRMLAKSKDDRFERCRDAANLMDAFLKSHAGPQDVQAFAETSIGEAIRSRSKEAAEAGGGEDFLISLVGFPGQDSRAIVTDPTLLPENLGAAATPDTLVRGVASDVLVREKNEVTGSSPLAELTASDAAIRRAPKRLWPAVAGGVGALVLSAGFLYRPKSSETFGSVDIRSPAGALVKIDGKPVSGITPLVSSGYSAGPHAVIAEVGGRTFRGEIEVAADGVAIVDGQLAGDVATLEVSSTPPGAEVWVGDHKLGLTPLKWSELPAGAHEIRVTFVGFKESKTPVALEWGKSKEIAVSLTAEPVASTSPSRPTHQAKKPDELAQVESKPVEAPVEAKPAPTERPAAPPADGLFTLATNPWAKIEIDGEPYGVTPVAKIRLRAGEHKVRLVNEEAGIDVSRTITINAGEPLKLNLKLP
ncbi:MAG: serine/threonine protein kinase [Deltaproteobacteria bacterium]|nr:serine/threonine protein kinase [Deltaproteobacteria bacterium]